MTSLSRQDVLRAAKLLKGRIITTPMLASAEVDDRIGRPVYVKAENVQYGGSFKYRGALHTLLSDVVAVSEPAIADAMAHLWRHYALKAEPSGAVAFAGLTQAVARLPDGPVGIVLSGGNVDWTIYRSLLTSSLERTDPHDPQLAAPVLL